MNIAGIILNFIGGFKLNVARNVVANNKLVSQSTKPYMGAGSFSGIAGTLLNSVIGGNMGALVRNPMGALMSAATAQLGQFASRLTSAIPTGENPSNAIPNLRNVVNGALSTALGRLNISAQTMSGMIPADFNIPGQYGPSDALSHARFVQSTPSVPAHMTMAKATGPVTSSARIQEILAAIDVLVQSVEDAPEDDANVDAVKAQVQAYAAEINGIVDQSTTAIEAARAASVVIGEAASIISDAIHVGDDEVEAKAFLDMVLQPQVKQAIADDKAARIAKELEEAEKEREEDEAAGNIEPTV